MRVYQENIYSALISKRNWCGNNTQVINKGNGVTEIIYYWSKIGEIDHNKRTAILDHCGYHTVSTSSRLKAIREFCNNYDYEILKDE